MRKIVLALGLLFVLGTVSAQKSGSLEEEAVIERETGFVAGTGIIFSGNFSKDAVGDFPAKWNSTKSGEVRTLKSFPDNFLKISDGLPAINQAIARAFYCRV